MKKARLLIGVLVVFLSLSAHGLFAQAEGMAGNAQDGNADLAQDLTNPLADLMTIPIQMNYDQDIGPSDEGERLQTNDGSWRFPGIEPSK